MIKSAFEIDQRPDGFRICVSPRCTDRLKLAICLILMLCAASVPFAYALSIAARLGTPFVTGTLLLLGTTF